MRTTRDLAQFTCTVPNTYTQSTSLLLLTSHHPIPSHAMPCHAGTVTQQYTLLHNDFQCAAVCVSLCVLLMFIGFTSLRSSAALKLCITYCHFSCNTLSNELCSNNNKKKQRNSAQYTKYNAFQHKQNFSSFFRCLPNES